MLNARGSSGNMGTEVIANGAIIMTTIFARSRISSTCIQWALVKVPSQRKPIVIHPLYCTQPGRGWVGFSRFSVWLLKPKGHYTQPIDLVARF